MNTSNIPHWASGEISAIFFVFITVLSVMTLTILLVMKIIACHRLFKKADVKQWKAFIPIYNNYVLYCISWKTSVFWVNTAAEAYLLLFLASGNRIVHYILAAAWIITVIIRAMLSYRISRSFGRGYLFAAGMFFLFRIFLLILAFGKSRYVGNSYIDDLIFSIEKKDN